MLNKLDQKEKGKKQEKGGEGRRDLKVVQKDKKEDDKRKQNGGRKEGRKEVKEANEQVRKTKKERGRESPWCLCLRIKW